MDKSSKTTDWKFREEAEKLQRDPKFIPTVPLSRLLPYLNIPLSNQFKCDYCGKDFSSNAHYRRYCSTDCSFLANRMKRGLYYIRNRDKLKLRYDKLKRKYSKSDKNKGEATHKDAQKRRSLAESRQ